MMNNKYSLIIVLIIILLNINSIKCSTTITFNNDIIFNCNITNPCDLSSKSVWLNNQVPVSGDDVIIDLSNITVNSNSSKVYLIAQNLNIQLNSFTFNGIIINDPSSGSSLSDSISSLSLLSSLVIQNCNFSIYSKFSIQYAQFNITQSNDDNNNIKINNFISNNTYITFNGNSNIQMQTAFIDGIFNTFINDNTTFTVINDATFNTNINHTSSGIFKTLGFSTTIKKEFISNGIVYFGGGFVYILGNGYIDTLNLVNSFYIMNDASFIIKEYITLNPLSRIYIQGSILTLEGSINNNLQLYNQILLDVGSTLYLPSGYNISNFMEMDGTIIITDDSRTTSLNNLNQKNLLIETPGNLLVYSSTLEYVYLSSDNSSLSIKGGNSSISKLSNFGQLNIDSASSLVLSNASTSSYVDIAGRLILYDDFIANNILVGSTGSINSNFKVNGSIYLNSGSVYFNQDNNTSSTIDSITITNSSDLTIGSPTLFVSNNFTINNNSTIHLIGDNNLNTIAPMIQINGVAEINTIIVSITFNQSLPKHDDKLVLFCVPNQLFYLINVPSINVKLLTGSNEIISNIGHSITQYSSDHCYRLDFIRSSSSLSKKAKIAIAIGLIIGIFALITIIIIIIKRRNNNQYQRINEI